MYNRSQSGISTLPPVLLGRIPVWRGLDSGKGSRSLRSLVCPRNSSLLSKKAGLLRGQWENTVNKNCCHDMSTSSDTSVASPFCISFLYNSCSPCHFSWSFGARRTLRDPSSTSAFHGEDSVTQRTGGKCHAQEP